MNARKAGRADQAYDTNVFEIRIYCHYTYDFIYVRAYVLTCNNARHTFFYTLRIKNIESIEVPGRSETAEY